MACDNTTVTQYVPGAEIPLNLRVTQFHDRELLATFGRPWKMMYIFLFCKNWLKGEDSNVVL